MWLYHNPVIGNHVEASYFDVSGGPLDTVVDPVLGEVGLVDPYQQPPTPERDRIKSGGSKMRP